jgi:Outer membrane protein beta-barrel domain
LRRLAFLATAVLFLFLASFASAQQGDAMIGFGTVVSPSNNGCGYYGGSGNYVCPEKGGLYVNVGGDVIFHRRFGAAFDIAWRGGQGNYEGTGQPYRPILFAFNGVYQPRISKKLGADLLGGIGWQSTRFYGYTYNTNCVYFGACYNSSNHFLIDAGAGLRYYFWHSMFVRPEVRYYYILNNTSDFSSNNVIRVGASIGYTIGGPGSN